MENNLTLYRLKSKNGLAPYFKDALRRGVFNVRYSVYHDEMGIIPENSTRQLSDKFDFINPTDIFLATDKNIPVGTIRLTRYSEEHGIPMMKYFGEDLEREIGFSEKIKKGLIFAEPSRLTVLKDYRDGMAPLVPGLLTYMLFDVCENEGITDLVMVANPEREKLYKSFGFNTFAKKIDNFSGVMSPAMHSKVEDSKPTLDKVKKFLDRQYDLKDIEYHSPDKRLMEVVGL